MIENFENNRISTNFPSKQSNVYDSPFSYHNLYPKKNIKKIKTLNFWTPEIEKLSSFNENFRLSDKFWNSWQWHLRNSFSYLKLISVILEEVQLEEKEFIFSKNNLTSALITPYYLFLLLNFKKLLNEFLCLHILSCQNNCSHGNKALALQSDEKEIILDVSKPCQDVLKRYNVNLSFKKFPHYTTKETIELNLLNIKKHNKAHTIIINEDLLLLNEKFINFILKQISSFKNINNVIVNTRIPIILPQKITSELLFVLKKYPSLVININIVDNQEITLLTEKIFNIFTRNKLNYKICYMKSFYN